jgi:hypothetical protein
VNCCSFYDASAIEASIEFCFRPNEHFEIAPGYEATFINLPAGSVDIHVVEVDSVINFTPHIQVALQAQYDNISQSNRPSRALSLGISAGSELFVAFGQGALIPDSRFIFQRTQLSIGLRHTLRF